MLVGTREKYNKQNLNFRVIVGILIVQKGNKTTVKEDDCSKHIIYALDCYFS